MTWITYLLIYGFTLSLAGNCYLYLKIKASKKAPQDTYDVTMLLHDLTRGPAILKLERIDPSSLFLRSPRDL